MAGNLIYILRYLAEGNSFKVSLLHQNFLQNYTRQGSKIQKFKTCLWVSI